jgi:hypothetical protein
MGIAVRESRSGFQPDLNRGLTTMKKHLLATSLLVCVLTLAGCGPEVDTDSSQPQLSRLGDTIELSLADLLNAPRADLAAQGEEWTTKIRLQQQAQRAGKLHLSLLPNLRLPLVVPGWRQAKYSAKAGFSLPAYAAEDTRDSSLAVHLARLGDVEAARKLVEANDDQAIRQIEAARYEREYPVEWTRLAGLLLHAAQLRLATGDVDGGTEVIALHRQLRELLDPRAARGPLGCKLLGAGRATLAQAAAAWREEHKPWLAEQAEAALSAWGEVAPVVVAIQPTAARAEVGRMLGDTGKGRALMPRSAARALDLFELPFPEEGAEAVIASLDASGQLQEMFLSYGSGTGGIYRQPDQLAHPLTDGGLLGQELPQGVGLLGRRYQLGDWDCDVTLVGHGAGVGAFVRLRNKNLPAPAPEQALNRDFGAVHLDQSFEQNRLRLAPEQRGEAIATTKTKPLAALTNPLPTLQPGKAQMQGEPAAGLTNSCTVHYPMDAAGPPPLHQVVLPLWNVWGAPHFSGVADDHGGHLAVRWEGAASRYTVRLPYENAQPVQFEAADCGGEAQRAQRQARAVALDRAERKARLAAGKPEIRIQRQLEQLELGMTRAKAKQALPQGRAVFKSETPDGLAVTFPGEPVRTDAYALRQLFVRFDSTDRVAELRARYGEGGSDGATDWAVQMLNSLRQGAGAPRLEPPSWATLWRELPPQKPGPVLSRWQDDISLLTYQRDHGGVEIALRDCPPEHENGLPLPPLEYLRRGPENCLLETAQAELLRQWTQPEKTADGAWILRPQGPGTYDVFLVWFDKERVSRIVARHRPSARPPTAPAQAGQVLAQAWARELATLGWPRRQDLTAGDILQSFGWHDERTRVRLFWQENDQGEIYLYTEWQGLAILPKIE